MTRPCGQCGALGVVGATPVEGSPAAAAKASLEWALADLDLVLGLDENDDDDFEAVRRCLRDEGEDANGPSRQEGRGFGISGPRPSILTSRTGTAVSKEFACKSAWIHFISPIAPKRPNEERNHDRCNRGYRGYGQKDYCFREIIF